MKRRIAVVWISLAMMLNMIVIVVDLAPPVKAAIITVDDSGGADFTKIQDAINASSDGDTVFVYSGIYYEQVVINKTINLVGEDRNNTVIDGGDEGIGLKIVEDWVNVSNIKIVGIGNRFFYTAMWIDSNNNSINNNTINCIYKFSSNGVFLNSSSYNRISDNHIFNNYEGLKLEYSHLNIIQNNNISTNAYGLLVENSQNNTIKNNIISSYYYGLKMAGSSNSTVSDNEITSNSDGGISLATSSHIMVSNNDLSFNGDYGLALNSMLNCTVQNNTFNGSGIYLKGGSIEYWDTHEIDLSNTISGKPIYYLKNQTGITVPQGAGQVILVNCSNIDIYNQEIYNASIGIASVFSSGINITENKILLCHFDGIYLLSTPGTNISHNNISSRSSGTIYAELSPDTTINNNTMIKGWRGIYLRDSPNSQITNNYMEVTGAGILIWDCGNHTITGNTALSSNPGTELLGECDGNYIAYNNFSSNSHSYGIRIDTNCDDNQILNNTLNDNYIGLSIQSSHGNNIKGNEIINNSDWGILSRSSDSIISENVISSNYKYGLSITETLNLNITKNEFINDGICIYGSDLAYFNSHEIPDDNTVNEKPLYYYKNTSGLDLDGISLGQLILVNCSDVNVSNLHINDTDVGIELAYVSNTEINACNTSSNDLFGMYLYESMSVNITGSEVVSNKDVGISLSHSQNNNIIGNNISFNNIEDWTGGIYLSESSENNIIGNMVFSNFEDGIYTHFSSNNVIADNDIFGNINGITVMGSNNEDIISNNISNNIRYGVHCNSPNTDIIENNITENYYGIYAANTNNVNISGNMISYNDLYGLYMYVESAELTLNEFVNDGIFLYGWKLSHYNTHEISINNMVNGKPLYYFKNATNIDVDGIPVGQLLIANCTHINVSNVQIEYTDVAIQIAYSSYINVTDSNISNNYHGVYALNTYNNRITGSTVSFNSLDGIYLTYSYNDSISNNFISSNGQFGINIYYSSITNLTNNVFTKDGIIIFGNISSCTSHNIPVNNIVNGKPLYYYKNVNGLDFVGISTGQLILANCTDIYVSNVKINDTDVGVELIYTDYSNITGSTLSNNLIGIFSRSSWYNSITANIINSNTAHGIELDASYYYKIEYNDIFQNNESGIYLYHSEYIQIFNNTISTNGQAGLHLYDSEDNEIICNNITFNTIGFWSNWDSEDNLIYHNNFIDNTIQISGEIRDNYWDNGYPSGGNYWSDFSPTCPDLYNGSIIPQITGSPDGICDYPCQYLDYFDRYPLKYPWGISSPDTVLPGTIADLEITDPMIDSLTLTWTAPGDDGDSGTAAGYVVKYSTSGPITGSNWDTANVYSQSWTPLDANGTETHVISGLESNKTYWFAIKAYDEMGNYGGISNSPSQKTNHTDMTPPAAIADLQASDPSNSTITLTWTAPADNGTDASSGSSLFYDIRYIIDAPVSDGNWDSATQISGVPAPGIPGSTEMCVISGLLSGTNYYFAIKACDEAPNWSPASNSPNETTMGLDTTPPLIDEINADPGTQEIGEVVTISAKVTDNVGVYSVSVEIRDPFSTIIGNLTMVRSGDYYYNETLFTDFPGVYTFTIWAVDINNNVAFKNGSFEIIETPPVAVDTTPPSIDNVLASPSSQELYGAVNITASVVDNVELEGVWVHIDEPDGTELVNMTMTGTDSSGKFWYERSFSDLGEYVYTIWAWDTSDNWNYTEGTFIIQDTTSPLADAGPDLNILQGEALTFDGSDSSDNHRVYNYTWNLEYDEDSYTLYTTYPSFTFEIIGNYTIVLTVTDPSGNSASDSIWINVVGVDSDDDGLTDWDEENIYGTEPEDSDTDDDGVNDGDEIERGTDPLVPDKGKEPEKSFIDNYWWIFLIIAIMIVFLLLFILSKRKEEMITEEAEKIEEEPSESDISDEPKESAPEIPASTTTAEDEKPVAEKQPVKRKPPRPPRAPKSQA